MNKVISKAKFLFADDTTMELSGEYINTIVTFSGINIAESAPYEIYISLKPTAKEIFEIVQNKDIIEIDRWYNDDTSKHADMPYKEENGRNKFQTSKVDDSGNFIVKITGPRPKL